MKYELRRHLEATDTTSTANTVIAEATDPGPSPVPSPDPGGQSSVILNPRPSPAEGRTPVNKTSETVRQEIVQAVLNEGLSFMAASEKFSLDRDTVSGIVRQYLSETGELESVRLAGKFYILADKVLNELNGRDLSSTSPSQLGVLAGIAVDKKIQLAGKPTAGNGKVSMRVAWKDGSGAVELTNGNES